MEVDYLSDTSLEIPSIIEAISSSIDDSRIIMDELERSTEAISTTTDSDHISEIWSPSVPQSYNENYYHQQNYQQSQMQWNCQQSYSPYSQYGYMTPSPYNSYYMQSPPVDYHQNYMYSNNMMPNYDHQSQQPNQPYVFNAAPSPQDSQHSCTICLRSFKSASNLSRHFMSKTHLKRLESKKCSTKVPVVRVRKPKTPSIGSPFTDISKDEREFLWQLDDEIWQFLKEYEEEKLSSDMKKDLVLPTPPLSPSARLMEGKIVECRQKTDADDKKVEEISLKRPHSYTSPQIIGKTESVLSISSTSDTVQSSSSPARSNSESSAESSKNDDIVEPPEPKIRKTEKIYVIRSEKVSTPAVLINEKGEQFEVIFSDENFATSTK